MRSPELRTSFGAGRKIRRARPVGLCAGFAACAAFAAFAVHAETIVFNDEVMVRESTVERPRGGMKMEQVERKFGEPTKRHETVGKPPITRWDYPQFSVFFEGDRVIHSVVVGAQPPSTTEQAARS